MVFICPTKGGEEEFLWNGTNQLDPGRNYYFSSSSPYLQPDFRLSTMAKEEEDSPFEKEGAKHKSTFQHVWPPLKYLSTFDTSWPHWWVRFFFSSDPAITPFVSINQNQRPEKKINIYRVVTVSHEVTHKFVSVTQKKKKRVQRRNFLFSLPLKLFVTRDRDVTRAGPCQVPSGIFALHSTQALQKGRPQRKNKLC